MIQRRVVVIVALCGVVSLLVTFVGLQQIPKIRPLKRHIPNRLQAIKGAHDKAPWTHKHKLFGNNIEQEDTGLNPAARPTASPTASPAVILLTYMRSGSSMTGDILQRHPDVFYVFEPMWAIEQAEINNRSITFLNGTELQLGTYNQTDVFLSDLKGWLTCDFTLITMQSLFSYFMRFGRKTEPILHCLNTNKFKITCVHHLYNMCTLSKIKIVKTLRITMKMAKVILDDIEGSKVIHLLRDPRATLQSRRVLIPDCHANFTGASGCTKGHCDSVWNNTREINALNPELKRRVVTVRYEDIVSSPLENAELLYNFIGMSFTHDVKQFVYNITLGGEINHCVVCNLNWQAGRTPESNSSSHITAWKGKLTLEELSDIQNACRQTMEYYDYKLYNIGD